MYDLILDRAMTATMSYPEDEALKQLAIDMLEDALEDEEELDFS